MDPSGRAYEDFVPPHRLVREPATHTLSVDLSAAGYKKEQIRVQMVHSHRRLIVRGERPVAGNRWSRFRLELRVPDDCDAKAVHARFEKGVVRVTMPGLAAPEHVAADAGPEPSPPANAAAAAPGAQGPSAVGGAARGVVAGGEEEWKGETATQKQETGQQRVVSAKNDGGHDDAGEKPAASPSSPGGYAFAQGRRKRLATTVVGLVLAVIGLGIYVKYSLWP